MYDDTPNSDLISAYLRELAHEHPESTVTTYRSAVRRADLDLQDVGGVLSGPDELRDWVATHVAWSTRQVYRAAIMSFYRWGLERGKIGMDYDLAAELPKARGRRRRPRPCSHEELRIILTRAREPMRTWSLIAAYEGARAIGLSHLRLPDDITEDVTYLLEKGGRERVVPTHPLVWEAVCGRKPGLIGEGLSRKQISARANREYDRIGVATVTLHRLRHWYGTYAQAAGGNSRVTQELLGHADLTTTQGYTAISHEAMRAAVLGLPQIIGATADAGPGPEEEEEEAGALRR
jgi:integrase/recombinase XerC